MFKLIRGVFDKSPLWLQCVCLLIWIVGPSAFWAIPPSSVEKGPTLCLSRLLFDFECYACGLTRATSYLMRGELDTAFQFNKLIVIVFPLLVITWLDGFLHAAKTIKKGWSEIKG